VETHEVLGIVLILRDVLARSLFEKYGADFDLLNRILDAYEPANRGSRADEEATRTRLTPGRGQLPGRVGARW
jgi:hypothetical protein